MQTLQSYIQKSKPQEAWGALYWFGFSSLLALAIDLLSKQGAEGLMATYTDPRPVAWLGIAGTAGYLASLGFICALSLATLRIAKLPLVAAGLGAVLGASLANTAEFWSKGYVTNWIPIGSGIYANAADLLATLSPPLMLLAVAYQHGRTTQPAQLLLMVLAALGLLALAAMRLSLFFI